MFRTRPGEARALIEDWINRPALRKLVEVYGGTWPTGELGYVVGKLAEFSEVWDYRAGKLDRHMFHDSTNDADPHADLTYRVARELGMMEPAAPTQSFYDYVLILGGLATGVEPRVRFAARLLDQGLEVRKQIAALGSFRPLREREFSVSKRYAPHGRFEVDHLGVMLADLFGSSDAWESELVGDPEVEPSNSSLISVQTGGDRPGLAVYAASSSEPETRPANTADTFKFIAERGDLQVGDQILAITSAIYLPYQHIEAARSLEPLRVVVETVAPPGTPFSPPSHPANAYRQEIRSGIMAMARLLGG